MYAEDAFCWLARLRACKFQVVVFILGCSQVGKATGFDPVIMGSSPITPAKFLRPCAFKKGNKDTENKDIFNTKSDAHKRERA